MKPSLTAVRRHWALATLLSAPIYEGLVEGSKRNGSFAHGVTYAGHPVASAVAVEALKIYEERDIAGHVRAVSPRFLARVHALDAHPLVAGTRGVGLIGAIELAPRRGAPGTRAFDAFTRAFHEQELLIRTTGDIIAMSPPLIIEAAQIDEIVGKLRRVLTTLD